MNGFPDAYPDIDETYAGCDAPNEVVLYECLQSGVRREEAILVPDGGPGKNGEQHSQLDAEHYEDDQRKPVQPDDTTGRGTRRGDRARFLHWNNHWVWDHALSLRGLLAKIHTTRILRLQGFDAFGHVAIIDVSPVNLSEMLESKTALARCFIGAGEIVMQCSLAFLT